MYLIKQHLRHYKYVILFSQDRSFRILCSLIKGTKPLSIINDITLKVYLWSKFLFIICDVKLTNAFWWFEKYNEKKCFLNNYKNGLYLSVFWYLFVFTHICPLIWKIEKNKNQLKIFKRNKKVIISFVLKAN